MYAQDADRDDTTACMSVDHNGQCETSVISLSPKEKIFAFRKGEIEGHFHIIDIIVFTTAARRVYA